MSTLVLVDRQGPVWRLTLNRPEQGNSLSVELVHELDEVLARAGAEAAQQVTIEGAGRHFCTGFDLGNLAQETDDTLLARLVRIELLLQRVARAPFDTVAAVRGRAMGAGADLFAACRIRRAGPQASFAFPGASGFGIVLGTRRLAERVGADTALDWVQSGRTIGAQEACRAGLVSPLADDADAIGSKLALHAGAGPVMGSALRRALAPDAERDDALDLALLVRSAARPGLRDRMAAYVGRAAAARKISP